QAPPATETEPATTGKNGPRPLMGLAPRPGASPELPKPPRDPAERRAWLAAQLDAVFRTPALARAKVSAIVVEADTGKTLRARRQDAAQRRLQRQDRHLGRVAVAARARVSLAND